MKTYIFLLPIIALGVNHSIESTSAFRTPYLRTFDKCFIKNKNTRIPLKTRLFFYNNSNDNTDKKGNVLKKIAKKVLPKKTVQSPREREQTTDKTRQTDEITGDASAILEDVTTQTEEQTKAMEFVLAQARDLISESPEVQMELGKTLIINDPFRQTPRSTSLNGKLKDFVQVTFDVMGSGGMASVDLVAENGIIKKLRLNVGSGRKIIDLVHGNFRDEKPFRNPYNGRSYRTDERTVFKTNPISRHDFIDVEIIDVDFLDLKP